MSEEKVLCSNYLTIRLDQLEDKRITWYVIPDEKVASTERLSLIDLAEYGAPLSAMAIKALWKLCIDGLVFNALEQANSIQTEIGRRIPDQAIDAELECVPDGTTIN